MVSARDMFTSAPKSIDIMGSVIPTSSAPTLAGNFRARVFNCAALSDVAPLGGIATASYPTSATPGKP